MTNVNLANMTNMNLANMTNVNFETYDKCEFAITTPNPEGVVGDAVATNFHQITIRNLS